MILFYNLAQKAVASSTADHKVLSLPQQRVLARIDGLPAGHVGVNQDIDE
jgi:hypothetical protein